MMTAAKFVQTSVITIENIAFQHSCQLNNQGTRPNVTPGAQTGYSGNTFLHSYLLSKTKHD